MGGCRCTYRNCTLRSDGKTHMFHYPVFDKVRCHQWLTNGHKLEFLNLKVSQLKNRVVCQHHFKDENFMNFKKDKLTFDAVPTEDGPYCDTTQFATPKVEPDVSKVYTISLEDIENEYLTLNDKKANFSVKYGDFLTSCDLMDLDPVNLIDNTQIVSSNKVTIDEPYNMVPNNDINRTQSSTKNITLKSKLLDTSKSKLLDTSKSKLLDINEKQNTLQLFEDPVSENPKVLQIEFEDLKLDSKDLNLQDGNDMVDVKNYHNVKTQETANNKCSRPKNKIQILSEKKVLQPFKLIGKLEPLPPTTVLPLPKKKKDLNADIQLLDNVKDDKVEITIDTAVNNYIDNTYLLENNVKPPVAEPFLPREMKNLTKPLTPRMKRNVVNKCTNSKTPPNTSLLKNKIPSILSPERAAAIQEKRKFNMKLRDIIETCLDKIDDQVHVDDKSNNGKYLHKMKRNKSLHDQVASYLSKGSMLPKNNEYTVAYLDARIKKMEDTLLKKIDQNTQRILELKNIVVPSTTKKTAQLQTQTVVNEEVQKKNLYQEISKYLSPVANNLIYEELFLNKYVPDVHPSAKRRKCD